MRLVQGKRKRAIEADAHASLDRNMKQIITMTVIGASLASCAVLSDKLDVTLRWYLIFMNNNTKTI